jgi:hypothetical protein
MFGVWELESLSSIDAGDDVLAQAGDGQLRADDAALQSQRVAGSQHLPHIALALHAAQVPPERFRAAVENLYYVSTGQQYTPWRITRWTCVFKNVDHNSCVFDWILT